MPKRKNLLYLSDSAESDDDYESATENDAVAPFSDTAIPKSTTSITKGIDSGAEDAAMPAPPKKIKGVLPRQLVGKYAKTLECPHCERPYKLQHQMDKHLAGGCPVLKKRDLEEIKRMRAESKAAPVPKPAPVPAPVPVPVPEVKPKPASKPTSKPVAVKKRKAVVIYESESSSEDESSSESEEEIAPVRRRHQKQPQQPQQPLFQSRYQISF